MSTTTKTLADLTTVELRGECKTRGIAYSGNDRKADLIDKLNAFNGPSTADLAAFDALTAPEPVAATDRVQRMTLASQEAKAMKAWRKAGAKGTPPATPNLDALNAEEAPRKQNGAKARPKAATTPKAPRAAKVALVYTRDGRDLPAGRGVSYQAWSCTKGIGGADVARISTADLTAILVEQGVTDTEGGPWEATLPNGTKIGARLA